MAMTRLARKAAALSVGAALSIGVLPATAAHAGQWVTWKNFSTRKALEVSHSSKKKGATVGTWPWNGTKTQWWWDQKLSNRYYVELNWNSNLYLTAYNSCGSGITQWPTGAGHHAYTTQEWKEKRLRARGLDQGWALINKAGCSGDAYHDMLSLSIEHRSWYPVFLYPQNYGACSIAMYPSMWPVEDCTWK